MKNPPLPTSTTMPQTTNSGLPNSIRLVATTSSLPFTLVHLSLQPLCHEGTRILQRTPPLSASTNRNYRKCPSFILLSSFFHTPNSCKWDINHHTRTYDSFDRKSLSPCGMDTCGPFRQQHPSFASGLINNFERGIGYRIVRMSRHGGACYRMGTSGRL